MTVQRRIILEAVAALSGHPTAEMVLDAIRVGHPEISRATVYRTLEMLVELGLVRKVLHAGNSIRYDSNMDRHHHLICKKCDKLIDLEDPGLDRVPIPSVERLGFRIDDFTIQFQGICAECRKEPVKLPARRGKRVRRRPSRAVDTAGKT